MRKKSNLVEKILLIFIFVIIVFGVSLYYNQEIPNSNSTNITTSQDLTNIKAYFCPEDCADINQAFKDINRLYCAIYDIEFPWFWNKAKTLYDSNKEVIIVTDDDQFYKNYTKLDPAVLSDINHLYSNGVVVDDKKSAYMHNKICVLDNKILVGSKNFNQTTNYDNFLIIQDKGLASIAKQEILEMHSGTFGKGEPSQKQEGKIQLYFCPEDSCEIKYKELLETAKERIHCEFFSMTLSSLSEIMLNKSKSGVSLQVLFEKSQISQYSQFSSLGDYSQKNKKGYIHNKFCIVDDTIITGSMNPSKNSTTQNDESIIIIQDSKLAEIYEKKFQEHWIKLVE